MNIPPNIDIFVSSQLRARQTASFISKEFTVDYELRERSWGDFEGFTYDDIVKKYGKGFVQKACTCMYTRPPKGESMIDVIMRIIPLITLKILPLVFTGKDVCIVSHSRTLSAIMQILNINQCKLKNAEVMRLQWDNNEHKFFRV